ncbi:hypothetical protein ACHAWF_006645 [Thalassiosira exigua]
MSLWKPPQFLSEEIEISFDSWLKKRKAIWRQTHPRKYIIYDSDVLATIGNNEDVQHDFWHDRYESFDLWLLSSKRKWARTYSWHKAKRRAIQTECERKVNLPMISPASESHVMLGQFENWLGVRKQQWRLERRKRQRHRVEMCSLSRAENCGLGDVSSGGDNNAGPIAIAKSHNDSSVQYWDDILEDQEHSKEEETAIERMDISWVFDSQLGAPDDVIANVMSFLCPSDHGNLLCLSYTSNVLLKQRSVMWRTLCPKHWVLPRRPRKCWCGMYINKIREEEEASRKRSDDLLVKANGIMEKGDQLNKLQKFVGKAEKEFSFSVNYTSGVVLERNSLLNLAVIGKRHKIIKWLVEDKKADIECCDRGQFTPLLNAAWNGDRYIVRYLLGKGCDRKKVGYNHFSQGLAPASFKGLNAEGWALDRGHDEIAKLISLGL